MNRRSIRSLSHQTDDPCAVIRPRCPRAKRSPNQQAPENAFEVGRTVVDDAGGRETGLAARIGACLTALRPRRVDWARDPARRNRPPQTGWKRQWISNWRQSEQIKLAGVQGNLSANQDGERDWVPPEKYDPGDLNSRLLWVAGADLSDPEVWKHARCLTPAAAQRALSASASARPAGEPRQQSPLNGMSQAKRL